MSMQQMLIAMGGAGADSYWYGLYSWGSQSGSLAKNHYQFTGISNDPDDNIFIAGQRTYNHQYYQNTIFVKLDKDGAVQAQKMYRTNTSGSYDSGGVLYQRYSDSNNNSGAVQESVIGQTRGSDCYWTMNASTLNPQDTDSIKVYNKEYSWSTLCGPPTGFKWDANHTTNTCPSIYRCGRDGYVGTIRFSAYYDRNSTSQNNGYSSNNATYVGSYRLRTYINNYYTSSQYWRGIDYIDDGVMAGGSSNTDYVNVQPNIILNGDISGTGYMVIGKFWGSSNMGVIWGRRLDHYYSNGQNWSAQCKADSSYGYYVFRSTDQNWTKAVGGIAKFDHNGNEQWTKVLIDSSSQSSYEFNYEWIELRGVDIDASGNCYVVGMAQATSSRAVGVVAKINANGTMGWQNIFYKTSSNSNAWTDFLFIRRNEQGSLVIVGYEREEAYPSPMYSSNGNANQYDRGIVLKVAEDGSGTGTYGNYTYGTSTFALINHTQSWQNSNTIGGGYNYQNPSRGYMENHEHSCSDTISTTSM